MPAAPTTRSNRLEALQQVCAFGNRARCVDMRMADDALGVHQEHRSRIHAALLVEHPVGPAHRAMRPVIRQQREGNAPQLLRPGFEARNGIRADLKNFNIQFLELLEVLTEPLDLVLSTAGEGEGQEGHHGSLSLECGKREWIAQMGGQ